MTHKVEKCPTCGATRIQDARGILDFMIGFAARLHELHRLVELLDHDMVEILDAIKIETDKLKLETVPREGQP